MSASNLPPSIGIAEAQHRDLYFYGLYRVLEAGLLALMLFGPARTLIGAPAYPLMGKATAVAYLVASMLLLAWTLRASRLRWPVVVGIATDIAAATLAIHAMPAAISTSDRMNRTVQIGAAVGSAIFGLDFDTASPYRLWTGG